MVDESDYSEIDKWLNDLLDGQLPSWEVDDYTIGVLKKLFSINSKQDRAAEEAVETLKVLKEKKDEDYARLKEGLSKLGITPKSLDLEQKENLTDMVNAALAVGLGHFSEGALAERYLNLRFDNLELRETGETQKEYSTALRNEFVGLSKNEQNLERVNKSLMDGFEDLQEKNEVMKNKIDFAENKTKDYRERLQKLDRDFVPKHLKLHKVVQLSEKVEAGKAHLTKLNKELEVYSDLPSDIQEAKKVIAKIEEDLQVVKEKLQERFTE